MITPTCSAQATQYFAKAEKDIVDRKHALGRSEERLYTLQHKLVEHRSFIAACKAKIVWIEKHIAYLSRPWPFCTRKGWAKRIAAEERDNVDRKRELGEPISGYGPTTYKYEKSIEEAIEATNHISREISRFSHNTVVSIGAVVDSTTNFNEVNDTIATVERSLFESAQAIAAAEGEIAAGKELIVEAEKDLSAWKYAMALRQAGADGESEIVCELVKSGAKIDRQDEYGRTALLIAAESGHAQVVDELLDCGAEIDHQNEDGATALLLASWSGRNQVVHKLLDRGAQIDGQNKNGWTALLAASCAGHTTAVRELLDRGADIRHQDGRGCTALHWAVPSPFHAGRCRRTVFASAMWR